MKNAAVIIPSYNARYNITKVIDKILDILPKAKIIIVDDNSPDKTYELIRSKYALKKDIKLIIREKKGGRGSAVIYGIKEGLKNKNIKYFIEMDADFSHDPKYIPKLIEMCHVKDVAIASKYLPGSKILDMPFGRKVLSIFANIFLKMALRIPISDYTNGFRCYTRKAITAINLNNIKAKGFIVLSEIAYSIYRKGFSFGEVPISITNYKEAGSNFSIHEIKEGIITIPRLFVNRLFSLPFLRGICTFLFNYKEILSLCILAIIFFHKIILHPQEMIYPAYDVVGVYSFLKDFFSQSVKQFGYLPLWNPYTFSGSPFLGNAQSSMFYPTSILYVLFPVDFVFGYNFLFDTMLMGIFTYIFAKTIHLSRTASLFSSVIMMFNGAFIGKLIPGHIFIMDGIIWLPLLLTFYELFVVSKKYYYCILASIPIAFMLLAGNPQIAMYNLLTAFFYLVFRCSVTFAKRKNFKVFLYIMILSTLSVFLGISLAAIQLIPSFEFSTLSAREDGLPYEFASDFSFHKFNIITFFLPHFFGSPNVLNSYWGINGNFWELCAYTGIAPLILGFSSLLFKRNKYTVFFMFLALFSLLFAMGRFGFIFPFFYNFIPGFNIFRAPSRFLFVYAFSIAMLAGIGIEIISKKLNFVQTNKINIFSIAVILLSLLPAGFFFFFFQGNTVISFIQSKGYAIGNNLEGIHGLIMQDFLLFSLFSFSIALIFQAKIKSVFSKKYIIFFIFLITLVDLWLFGLKFYDTQKTQEVYTYLPKISIKKADNNFFRVFDYDGKYTSALTKNKVQTLTGYDAVYLKDYRDFLWLVGKHQNTPYESFFSFLSIDNFTFLKMLNTKYIITENNISSPEIHLLSSNKYNLYQITDTLPRAFIVPNAITVEDRRKTMQLLSQKNFNPKETVILEKDVLSPKMKHTAYKSVSITKYEPNSITLETSLKKPGYLILSEIMYPGWKAYDNNKEVEILRANLIFRSVFLKEGQHTIIFRYDPFSYNFGKIISLFSFILLIGTITYSYNTRRNSNVNKKRA